MGCLVPGCDTISSHSDTTGVDYPMFSKSVLSIYPNPASETFNISLESGYTSPSHEIKILNIQGQAVYYMEVFDQMSFKQKIDVSKWPSRLYLLQVYHKNRLLKTKKLVVE